MSNLTLPEATIVTLGDDARGATPYACTNGTGTNGTFSEEALRRRRLSTEPPGGGRVLLELLHAAPRMRCHRIEP